MAIELKNPPVDNSARIAVLERKLAAREGKDGYKQNVADLRAEIARLKA
jgi:hypothetical protein